MPSSPCVLRATPGAFLQQSPLQTLTLQRESRDVLIGAGIPSNTKGVTGCTAGSQSIVGCLAPVRESAEPHAASPAQGSARPELDTQLASDQSQTWSRQPLFFLCTAPFSPWLPASPADAAADGETRRSRQHPGLLCHPQGGAGTAALNRRSLETRAALLSAQNMCWAGELRMPSVRWGSATTVQLPPVLSVPTNFPEALRPR